MRGEGIYLDLCLTQLFQKAFFCRLKEVRSNTGDWSQECYFYGLPALLRYGSEESCLGDLPLKVHIIMLLVRGEMSECCKSYPRPT